MKGCGRLGHRSGYVVASRTSGACAGASGGLLGQPQAIRFDTGPEFLAERFISWCAERGIELRYIQPGESDQRAFIEHYNGTDRTEVLNANVFESVDQVREITAEWLQSYNEERPQDASAGLPPATYRARLETRSSPIEVAP